MATKTITAAIAAIALALSGTFFAHAQGATWNTDKSEVRIPGSLAYSYPNRDAIVWRGTHVAEWKDARQSLVWYGKLATTGTMNARLSLRLPKGAITTLRLTVTPGGVDNPQTTAAKSVTVTATGAGVDAPVIVSFPALMTSGTGWTRFTLTGLKKSGATFGEIDSLSLSGSAISGAFFNTTNYRSTASVHLGYHPAEGIGAIDAFYTEVKAVTDPVVTYYCAIGWSRGYMGYQINSPTERRIIFSVWDAGSEKVDQAAVAQKDRAAWLEHGPGVYTDRFGNEGTGGHSHLVYPWKKEKTYRFLVTSQTDGPDHVIYAGYFFFPEKNAWGLIGKIRTPAKKAGDSASEAALHGLYSFDEDFSGAAGDKLRSAEFGTQWAHTTDGKWHEVIDAHFSNTDRKREQRDDYDARPTPDGRAFILSTGGYVSPNPPVVYGDKLRRKPTGTPPPDLDQLLKALPRGIASESKK